MAKQMTGMGLNKKTTYVIIAAVLALILLISAVITSWLTSKSFEISLPKMTTSAETGEYPMLEIDTVVQNVQNAVQAKALEKKLNQKLDRALSYIEEENYEEAIPLLEELKVQLEETEDVGPLLRSTLAELYYFTEQYERCASLCSDICSREEDTEGFYSFMAAICKLQTEDYEGAAKRLTDAIDRGYSETAICYYFRGITRLVQEKFAEAEPDFKAALDNGYDKTECYYNYGICAYVAEEYDIAAEAMNTVLERNDDAEYTEGAQAIIDSLTE